MARPFDRATGADCAMWVADWVRAATGIDPAAPLRGSYRTGPGALRIILNFGGYEQMWRLRMAMSGFETTEAPKVGDVGVVRDAAGSVVAAIRLEGQWAAKGRHGIVCEDFARLAAWDIGGTLSRG